MNFRSLFVALFLSLVLVACSQSNTTNTETNNSDAGTTGGTESTTTENTNTADAGTTTTPDSGTTTTPDSGTTTTPDSGTTTTPDAGDTTPDTSNTPEDPGTPPTGELPLEGCSKVIYLNDINVCEGDPSFMYQACYSLFTPELGKPAEETTPGSDEWLYVDYFTILFQPSDKKDKGTYKLGDGANSNFATANQSVFVDVDFDNEKGIGTQFFFATHGSVTILDSKLDGDGWVTEIKGYAENIVLREATLDDEDKSTLVPNGQCLVIQNRITFDYKAEE